MKNEAIVLWLENVRDLEVIKYKIENNIAINRNELNNVTSIQTVVNTAVKPIEYKSKLKKFKLPLIIIFILFFALFAVNSKGNSGDGYLMISMYAIFAFFGIIVFDKIGVQNSKSINNIYNYKQKEVELKNKNIEEKKDKAYALYNKNAEKYNKELSQVNKLLEEFYSMKIIPSQFRTLSYVMYLYDYMSSYNEATLEQALYHSHIEDGILRIESKLNILIDKVNDLIYETRMLREASQTIISQNTEMIESLSRVEKNQKIQVEYQRLNDCYQHTNSYFQNHSKF